MAEANFRRAPAAIERVKLYNDKIEELLQRAGVRESSGDEEFKNVMLDSQGKTSPAHGRILVEWYLESTGRGLETATP
jgi:hypothetical protein